MYFYHTGDFCSGSGAQLRFWYGYKYGLRMTCKNDLKARPRQLTESRLKGRAPMSLLAMRLRVCLQPIPLSCLNCKRFSTMACTSTANKREYCYYFSNPCLIVRGFKVSKKFALEAKEVGLVVFRGC